MNKKKINNKLNTKSTITEIMTCELTEENIKFLMNKKYYNLIINKENGEFVLTANKFVFARIISKKEKDKIEEVRTKINTELANKNK